MIIFENTQILGLNKPRFLHSTGFGQDTLSDVISKLCPQALLSSPKAADAGLVNRLDFETTGVVIIAKTKNAWFEWHNSFLKGEIKKEYFALLEGALVNSKSVINFLGSRYRGSSKVTISECPRARFLPAQSYIEPLMVDASNRCSLVRVSTSTGRRHQVRAHCAYVGHPLIGDLVYGASGELVQELGFLAEHDYHGKVSFLLHASLLLRGTTTIEAPLVSPFKEVVLKIFSNSGLFPPSSSDA